MKKFFLLFSMLFIFSNCVHAYVNIYTPEYAQNYKDYILRKEKFNAINYNALQLTPEQIDQYEDLTKCDNNSYSDKLNELVNEIQKYQLMKKYNLPYSEIYNQKRHIRKLYSELSKISNRENKKLKKILTSEQRHTYNTMKHLERHDIKKQSPDYYKKNPKMPVFGNIDKCEK